MSPNAAVSAAAPLEVTSLISCRTVSYIGVSVIDDTTGSAKVKPVDCAGAGAGATTACVCVANARGCIGCACALGATASPQFIATLSK